MIKTTIADGSLRAYTYNRAGELTQTAGGPEGTTGFVYDLMGRQIQVTDANGRTRTTRYDNLGRVTRVENEMGQPVRYSFDLANRRLSLTDANNNTTRYVFDNDSRLISMTYPGGEQESYFYDGSGLLISKVTPNRDTIRYTHNPAGALMSVKATPAGIRAWLSPCETARSLPPLVWLNAQPVIPAMRPPPFLTQSVSRLPCAASVTFWALRMMTSYFWL